MKKSIFPLIVLIYSLFIAACSQSPDDMIVGSWKLVDIKSNQTIPESDKQAYNEAMEELKANTLYVFNKDLSYETTNSGITTKGTWNYNDEKSSLDIVDETGGTYSIKVTEIASGKLILEEEEDGVITTLIFNK